VSDNLLILIPADPQYVPDAAAQQKALSLFASFVPMAEHVRIQVSDEVEFVATDDKFERIVCPSCGDKLDTIWWQQAMDTAYQCTKFANLAVKLPCCQHTCSLNDLCYNYPTGFARFRIEASNPRFDIGLSHVNALENIVSCHLKKVWAYF